MTSLNGNREKVVGVLPSGKDNGRIGFGGWKHERDRLIAFSELNRIMKRFKWC